MKEIFVTYNETTGYIDGGVGRIDREWDAKNADGSTMSERISLIMKKNMNRKVIYLPDQALPDLEKHKIVDGKIVELTEADKQPAIEAKLNEEKIQAKMRELAIQSLKANGELAQDYNCTNS